MDALELFDKKFKRKVTPDANNNMLIGVRACVFKKRDFVQANEVDRVVGIFFC